jgi:hypothetical protein
VGLWFVGNYKKMATDFYPGMKVCLDGEYGVVMPDCWDWDGVYYVGRVKHQVTPSKNYGLIRWDTDKESDLQDWTGLFGSFIQTGGEEVDQNHQFQFINDDGSLKK